MLQRLHIRNYLLIHELDLSFEKGLSIITGETGSGKSILIGALGLAMGERAEAGTQRDPALRCVIELEVDTKGLDLQAWFTQAEVVPERFTILRRQLDPGGRSRAFVNDTPVNLDQLRELGGKLIHVHSQHHTLLLNDPRFQLGLVDHLAGQKQDVHAFGQRYSTWRALAHELKAATTEQQRAQVEQDFLSFQLNELEEARLIADEQGTIEQELGRAEHAEEIIQALHNLEEGLSGDRGALGILTRSKQFVAKAARLDPEVAMVQERLGAAHIELKDLSDEASRIADLITVDPAKAAKLRERLDLLQSLQQKHRVTDIAGLIALRDQLQQRLIGIGSLEERVITLTIQESDQRKALELAAKALSEGRAKAIGPFSKKVGAVLLDLGMPHAQFLFDHRTTSIGPSGMDSIYALFTANKDRALAPLEKVASGGELSRVMLAMISLAANSQSLPTVVFDEIDTGVSGEVADRVGNLMKRMAKDRQVLAITHLPQIASKADTHLVVEKDQKRTAAETTIRKVLAEDRVEVLAHMLSGRKLTKAAMDNAKALLEG
ncbi:MAG: DNA repair protein RecN [Flavobacteriales bacterium]|nr:DNA repair protein RecN [Flavobacteriales bacterium]